MIKFFYVIAGSICVLSLSAQNTPSFKFIDKSNMDFSVRPGDNFYEYANGNWIRNNPVPPSKTRWGSFDVLREVSSKRMKDLLEASVISSSQDRKSLVIGNFYSSGMDSASIERQGYLPIASDLKRVQSLSTIEEVLLEIARIRTIAAGTPLFTVNVSADRKNVKKYITYIGQGGTTLPDRDYYLKNDSRSQKIRNALVLQITKMFALVGDDKSHGNEAEGILSLETTLARAQLTRVEMRDPYKLYNKYSLGQLQALTPNMPWKTMLEEMHFNNIDSVIVNNPVFFITTDSLLKNVPLATWKNYLSWNIIRTAAPNLSSAFVQADFELTAAQTGQKQQTPRWQRMGSLIDRTLGDFLGELYVQKYFKPEAKERMIVLVKNLEVTLATRIRQLNWMSDITKKKALEKLNAFVKKIAYPDKWKTYDGLSISKDQYLQNVRNTGIWAYNYNVNKIGKPVDRTEMGMTPPTINASYSPTDNDITFPAGILQFPFFDFNADDAVNYGGIGAVIGHEIIHGFDDQGRKSDAIGNLVNWWEKEDGDKFKIKSDQVVNQYNAFTVLDSINVNGNLTLGENLADLGGLSIAYEAFTRTKQFKENKKKDGFTPAQRFFLNFAQIWRNNILPENEAQLILTDPHSPGVHRANGPIVNIDAWYKAFNVKPGDKMYKTPSDRIRIW
ncbi:MAG: M13 family metallopeptidase [Ferruginibacter sp.]